MINVCLSITSLTNATYSSHMDFSHGVFFAGVNLSQYKSGVFVKNLHFPSTCFLFELEGFLVVYPLVYSSTLSPGYAFSEEISRNSVVVS